MKLVSTYIPILCVVVEMYVKEISKNRRWGGGGGGGVGGGEGWGCVGGGREGGGGGGAGMDGSAQVAEGRWK